MLLVKCELKTIFSWIVCEFSIHFRRANNNKPLKCADKNEFGEGSVSAIIDLDSDSDESNLSNGDGSSSCQEHPKHLIHSVAS